MVDAHSQSHTRVAGRGLPAGSLTLLFTDIEGSTRLLQDLGDEYDHYLAKSISTVRDAVQANGGEVVSVHGDAVFAVFRSPHGGVKAAIEAQGNLQKIHWPAKCEFAVRMGLHTGKPRLINNDYVGLDIHRAARICDAGNGGQILLSKATYASLNGTSRSNKYKFVDLGAHVLKDLRYPEVIYEAVGPTAPNAARPLRTMSKKTNNLPAIPAPIIGRETDISSILAAFEEKGVRLATLTGPGGAGKTRLALEVAHLLTKSQSIDAYYVSLASISDPILFVPAIIQKLSFSEYPGPGSSPFETLVTNLSSRKTLLLLDNFETVIESASVVSDLLSRCGNLNIIVTSQERLNVQSENEFRVLPLETLADKSLANLEKVAGNASVRLFVERIQDFDRDFSLTADNAEVLGKICRRLDGLPLAIELAASHIRKYPPDVLLAKLRDRSDLAAHGRRDLEGRHRSLREIFGWSYHLLADDEKQLLQRLSVFAGGATMDAIVSVAGTKTASDEEIEDRVFLLCDKNLVRKSWVQGDIRYSMLGTIKHYANELLISSPDSRAVNDKHCAYFCGLVGKMAPGLMGGEQRNSVNRLLDEMDNIRAALQWALRQPSAANSATLLNGLIWLWIPRGQFTEGLRWINQAIEQTAEPGEPLQRALVLDAAGWLELFSGDHETASIHCAEALELFLEHGGESDVARTKMTSGITKAVTGHIPEGPMLIVEALELHRQLNDQLGIALALIALGEGSRAAGDIDGAAQHQLEALALVRHINNKYLQAGLLHNLSLYYTSKKSRPDAAASTVESIEIAEEFNYPLIRSLCVAAAGAVALMDREFELAANLFGASKKEVENLGAAFEPNDQLELKKNMDIAKRELGKIGFDRAFKAGKSWDKMKTFEAVKQLCAGG